MNYRTETKTVYIADDNVSFDNENDVLGYCLLNSLKSMIGNSQAQTLICCLRRNGSLTKMFSDFIASLDEPEVKQMEDGWIEWKGGECPVPAKTLVETRLRALAGWQDFAKNWCWKHTEGAGDIVAYRVVSD